MRKEDFLVPMDFKIENGIYIPGNFPSQFDWKFFDSIDTLKECGTTGRLEHSYYLFHYASILPDNSLILEIGTWRGGSAIAIGMGIIEKNSKIITIDPGLLPIEDIEKRKDELYRYELKISNIDEVLDNIKKAKLEKYITIIPDTSENVLKKWNGRLIDMIFIDGSHRYEDVKIDCQWLQYIKSGGIAVFDDWIESVQRAAKEYFANKPEWKIITDSTDQPLGYPWKTVYMKN